LLPAQHFTEPPPRYTEASLVKILEEKGIGRPSTYAPTIETIVTRGYVRRVEKKFEPTELGFVVVDLLKEYFEKIVDVEFTAGMEDRLDDIADGDITWLEVLQQFYGPFNKDLNHAEAAIGHVELPVQVSDVKCDNCGKMMVIKQGRYGDFLACPGFPECRQTKPLLKETGAQCPKCQGAVVERRTKRGKKFFGCENYPACDFTTWDAPLAEKCSQCGAFMVRHRYKNGGTASRVVRHHHRVVRVLPVHERGDVPLVQRQVRHARHHRRIGVAVVRRIQLARRARHRLPPGCRPVPGLAGGGPGTGRTLRPASPQGSPAAAQGARPRGRRRAARGRAFPCPGARLGGASGGLAGAA